ncbi:MAG: glycosyltransferase family 2 protein [Holophaga sp.]|nr:glycosyltransferase family 2 protein [Holophaga sp.]
MHETKPLAAPLPTVVLIHYGAPDLTRRCLESLCEIEKEPHAAVVVDHGPKPGLGDSLVGAHPHLTILDDFSNPGFGSGCNRGAEYAFAAGAPAVWFLNNDALLEGPTLAPLLRLAEAHPQVGLWGTHQLNGRRRQGTDRMDGWFSRGLHLTKIPIPSYCRQLGPRETLSGASILVPRRTWDLLGPWPNTYFLYWEDVAWCRKAHALDLPLVITDLQILHRSARTVGKRSPLQAFYSARNRLLLHRELHPDGHLERFWIALYLFQMRLFQGRINLVRVAGHGIWAAHRGQTGRDPRY